MHLEKKIADGRLNKVSATARQQLLKLGMSREQAYRADDTGRAAWVTKRRRQLKSAGHIAVNNIERMAWDRLLSGEAPRVDQPARQVSEGNGSSAVALRAAAAPADGHQRASSPKAGGARDCPAIALALRTSNVLPSRNAGGRLCPRRALCERAAAAGHA